MLYYKSNDDYESIYKYKYMYYPLNIRKYMAELKELREYVDKRLYYHRMD